MSDLIGKVYELRDQASSLAKEFLAADHIEAFKHMNNVIIDISALARSLSDGESLSRHEEHTGKGDVMSTFPLDRPIEIFRRYKGKRYEATLDPLRIQPDGRGRCIFYDQQWQSASGSASSITQTAVDGWWNFWRLRDTSGVERPINQIRIAVMAVEQ